MTIVEKTNNTNILIQARSKKYVVGIVLIALLIWIDGIYSQDMTISTGKTTTVTLNSTTKTLYVYIDNASSSSFWMDLKLGLSFDKDGTFSVTVTHTDSKVAANSFKKTVQLTKSSNSNRILQQIAPGATTRYVQIDILPPAGLTTAQMDVYVKFGDYPLSEGDIIGIIIGCIAAGLILAFFGSFYLHKLRSKRQRITIPLMVNTFFETIREIGYLAIRFIKNIKDAISKLDCGKPASESETTPHHHYTATNQQPIQNYNYNYNATNTQVATTTASTNAKQEAKNEDTAVQYHHNDYDDIEQVDPIQVHVETTNQINLKQDNPKQQETNVYDKQEPLAPAYEEPVRYEQPKIDPVEYAQIVLPQPTPIDDNVPRIPRVFVPQAVSPTPISHDTVFPNQQDDNIVIPNIPLPANLV